MSKHVLWVLALSTAQACGAFAGEANNPAAVEVPAGTGVYFTATTAGPELAFQTVNPSEVRITVLKSAAR